MKYQVDSIGLSIEKILANFYQHFLKKNRYDYLKLKKNYIEYIYIYIYSLYKRRI